LIFIAKSSIINKRAFRRAPRSVDRPFSPPDAEPTPLFAPLARLLFAVIN
jgi:hypothetical protein